ncbi:chaperone protein HtpG [Coprobacillus sp. CAG:698]|mgnify:FL=1|nr:chaperone protein HtpG [Coprobacillus sp. CAG:698]
MSEVRQYKTESKRLLDLMINSIYTNKEIFLRELISNASDAIDKYNYLSLTNDKLDKTRDYQIFLEIDKDKKTLSITDNGIGMTKEELIDSLGTIAKSGSYEFLKKLDDKDKTEKEKIDIIGQFGVGFYSSYMVSSKVEVYTKSPFSEKGYMFSSTGTEDYTIDECENLPEGTKIVLYIKDDTEEEKYSDYLNEYRIKTLVKKYSDYIRYPIKMEVTKFVPKKDENGKEIENETVEEKTIETLNSQLPIWKKKKNEVTDEELNEFYKNKYYDYQDPLTNIFINVEGALNYTALIFIPKKAPYNLYSENYEKGLQLYTKGVFIMDKCKDLVPDYFRFVKGLVDSNDLSLNISREILQQNSVLKKIASNIEKKIASKLESMLKNDRKLYEEFFENYGVNLKYGIYDKYGLKKELLQDLILFKSVKSEGYITLNEYVEKMVEGQECIYYASGKTKEAVEAMPQMDRIKGKGYDVLICEDDIDEFMLQVMTSYKEKMFKSVNQGDADALDKEEEDKLKELQEDKKSMLEKIKEILADEVSDVVISRRLTDSPVCLVSTDGLSFEMQKVMEKIPTSKNLKADKVLEINPNHKLFETLENLYNDNDPSLSDYVKLLYDQALLIEGFPIKDPVEFSKKMCNLMINCKKY